MNKNGSGYIAMVETGKRHKLPLMTACELVKAFGIGLDELVEGTEYDLRSEQSK